MNDNGTLTKDEERMLYERIHSSDEEDAYRAKNELFEANTRLATYLAGKFSRTQNDFGELYEEALLGLWESIDHFNPDRGMFVNIASYYMERNFIRKFRDSTVKVSRNTNIAKIRNAFMRYYYNCGVSPSVDELVDMTGIRREICERYAKCLFVGLSFDKELKDDDGLDGSTMLDIFVNEEDSENDDEHKKLMLNLMMEEIMKLDDWKKVILGLYFGLFGLERRKLREIGAEFGKSGESIRTYIESILEEIRTNMKEKTT